MLCDSSALISCSDSDSESRQSPAVTPEGSPMSLQPFVSLFQQPQEKTEAEQANELNWEQHFEEYGR